MKIDKLLDKYLVTKDQYNVLIKSVLPNSKGKNAHYDTLRKHTYLHLNYLYKGGLNHNVDFQNIKIDSIKTLFVKSNKLFTNDYKDDLLGILIYCSDQSKKRYSFTIGPMVLTNGTWNVFGTEFDFKELFDE